MGGLTVNGMVTAGMLAITLLAIWRRRDGVPLTLLGGLGVATWMGHAVSFYALPGVLALIDGAVAIGMVVLLTHCMELNQCVWCDRARRAQAVAVIGAGKAAIGFMFVLAQMGSAPVELPWTPYAWAINIGFVAQVAIAGGWLDGLAVFLAGLPHRFGRFAHGAAHHRGHP